MCYINGYYSEDGALDNEIGQEWIAKMRKSSNRMGKMHAVRTLQPTANAEG